MSKHHWEKEIWFSSHAIERLIESKKRGIFRSVDEGRREIKRFLAKGAIFKHEEPNKYYCVYRKHAHLHYTIVFADIGRRVAIITGYLSKNWEIDEFKRLKRG